MKAGRKPKILIERIPAPFASIYEKATAMVIDIYYAPLAEDIISALKVGRLLDLGTGPGHLPIEIAKRSSDIRVDAIDVSPRLIETARANAYRAGVADKVNFEVGNAFRLRFDEASYDMVISTGMLHMVKDPVGVAKECRRVLKRGGKAWIYDPAQVTSQVDIRRWKASFTLRERFMYLLFLVFAKINPGRSYDKKEAAAIIEAAGFRQYAISEDGGELKIKMKK